MYTNFFSMQTKKKLEVFANRYYYEGSHGVVSFFFSFRLIYLICPRRTNRLVVSSRKERKFPIGHLTTFFFSLSFYVRCCRSSLSIFLLSLFFLALIREKMHTSDLLLLLFDMHFYMQKKIDKTHLSYSLY